MKNSRTLIDRTGTTTVTRTIKYICTLLCGEALRKFDKLESQVTGTTNVHLNFIEEGLLKYLSPINALSKKKHAMRIPQDPPFKRFTTWLTEMKNYLMVLPQIWGEVLQGYIQFFEWMEIAEKVYKGGTPSKTTTREESDFEIHVR